MPLPRLRRPVRSRAFACVMLASGLVGPAVAGQYLDEIYKRGKDKPLTVSITGESIDGFTTASRVTIPIIGVVQVRYAGASRAFRDAESYRNSGRFDDAINSYQSAIRTKNLLPEERRFWVDPTCLFRIAECYFELGDLEKAGQYYGKVLGEHAKSRFVPDATLGLGRVQLHRRQFAAAFQSFQKIEELAQKRGWDEWLYTAYLWQARARRLQGQFGPAGKLVDQALRAPPKRLHHILIQARTEQALIQLDSGKYEEASRLLQLQIDKIGRLVADEIRSGGTQDTMQRTEARCYNALGHCHLKHSASANDEAKKKQHLHEALLAFLWTVVLYPNLPEYTEAVEQAANCFERLGQRARAAELRREIAAEAPKAPQSK